MPVVFFATNIQAQKTSIPKPKIGASVSYCVFTTPENQNYFETYLTINSNTVLFKKNNNGKKSAAVEITMLLKKDTSIIQFDKYILNSQEMNDTDKIAFNLIDLKRFSVPNGTYNLALELKDVNNIKNSVQAVIPIVIDVLQNEVALSDIQLIESYKKTTEQNIFSKNGYDMIPYTIDFYPTQMSKLAFYTEVYNTPKILVEEDFLINYSVRKSNSTEVVLNLNKFLKQKPKPVNVVFADVDIAELPSGNYDLVIEIKNKKNEIITGKKIFFQRSNKNVKEVASNFALIDVNNTFVQKFSKEEIRYQLKSIYPIAGANEKEYMETLLKSDDMNLKQKFLLNFWTKRNKTQPYEEWMKYTEEVKKVNSAYSTQISHGFETDRGRVYLQYGAPNDIQRANREPGTYPYEIWQYYTLNESQKNVIFVFYNPDLVSNDYALIHSDARGELSDSRWKFKVANAFKELNGSNNFDNTTPGNSFGSRINEWGRPANSSVGTKVGDQ